MALGDGIRRNVATVSKLERDQLRDAIIKLHTDHHYPGAKGDLPLEGGVSFWFKQDEIHDATHVHSCPPFLTWHRELVNRFEALIRQVNPQLSLHYWDWTQDPRAAPDGAGGTVNLFTAQFMGLPDDGHGNEGPAGNPWEAAGFYDTNAAHPQREVTGKHGDPPASLTRAVGSTPLIMKAADDAVIGAGDYPSMRALIEISHNQAHSYIGGTISNPHISFRDPFVFLLHSNVDRLFAMWQRNQDPLPHPDRVNPATVYGSESNTKGSGQVTLNPHSPWGILSPLEPWARTTAQNNATGIVGNFNGVRPWELASDGLGGPPDFQAVIKDSKDPTVIAPPLYDTNVFQHLDFPAEAAGQGALRFQGIPAVFPTNAAANKKAIYLLTADGRLAQVWDTDRWNLDFPAEAAGQGALRFQGIPAVFPTNAAANKKAIYLLTADGRLAQVWDTF